MKKASPVRGFTLIELLIVVAIIGIIAAIAIPNLLNAVHRGKQKRTMAELRTICTAVESYQIDNGLIPRGAANGPERNSNASSRDSFGPRPVMRKREDSTLWIVAALMTSSVVQVLPTRTPLHASLSASCFFSM